jgi:hypothetical protein
MPRERVYEVKSFLAVRAPSPQEAERIAGEILDQFARNGDPRLFSVSIDDCEPYRVDHEEDEDALV